MSAVFLLHLFVLFFNSLCFLFPLSHFSCAFRLNVCYNCLFAHCLLPLACIFLRLFYCHRLRSTSFVNLVNNEYYLRECGQDRHVNFSDGECDMLPPLRNEPASDYSVAPIFFNKYIGCRTAGPKRTLAAN